MKGIGTLVSLVLSLLLTACVGVDSESSPLQLCPTHDPHTGDSCVQFPSGYQCGPCVCTSNRWACSPSRDGGGQPMCPACGPTTGDSCAQFPSGYQCGPCVCTCNRWSCGGGNPDGGGRTQS